MLIFVVLVNIRRTVERLDGNAAVILFEPQQLMSGLIAGI
jgi:hypothetical protein